MAMATHMVPMVTMVPMGTMGMITAIFMAILNTFMAILAIFMAFTAAEEHQPQQQDGRAQPAKHDENEMSKNKPYPHHFFFTFLTFLPQQINVR